MSTKEPAVPWFLSFLQAFLAFQSLNISSQAPRSCELNSHKHSPNTVVPPNPFLPRVLFPPRSWGLRSWTALSGYDSYHVSFGGWKKSTWCPGFDSSSRLSRSSHTWGLLHMDRRLLKHMDKPPSTTPPQTSARQSVVAQAKTPKTKAQTNVLNLSCCPHTCCRCRLRDLSFANDQRHKNESKKTRSESFTSQLL